MAGDSDKSPIIAKSLTMSRKKDRCFGSMSVEQIQSLIANVA